MGMTIKGTEYESGDYPKLKELLKVKTLTEVEERIITYWAKCEVEFKSLEIFTQELKTLKGSWDRQKLFYGESLFKEWAKSAEKSAPKLFSARPYMDAVKLYWWAKQEGLRLGGKHDYLSRTDQVTTSAPFSGHFGDRAQTFKHRQQKSSGGGSVVLVIIELNPAGAKSLSGAKIESGGEGKNKGSFGLKQEKESISVAIGGSNETWTFLKNKISEISFEL